MTIKKDYFGEAYGREVDLYTLDNGAGMQVRITTYGGIVTHLFVPDRQGKSRDVVLGFDELKGYLRGHPHFGAITGRYAGRIGNARFTLDGETYELARNDGMNHIHGGEKGFDKVIWEAATAKDPHSASLILSYLSPHMEEGYPGNLKVKVTYTLRDDNVLEIRYTAETDRPTVLNLTNHSYFNLEDPRQDILDHVATIRAGKMLETRDDLIPTGRILEVAGTPYDFRKAKPFGQDIAQTPMGYDLCYVLDGGMTEAPRLIAEVTAPRSGIALQVETTEPGVQLYTANFLDGSLTGKEGVAYQKHAAFCLETQHFPDSPNHPEFPSVRLDPGQTYQQHTLFRFLVKE